MSQDDIYISAEWTSIKIKNRDFFSSAELEINLRFSENETSTHKTYMFYGVVNLLCGDLFANNYIYWKLIDISSYGMENINWDVVGFEMDNQISFKCESFDIVE